MDNLSKNINCAFWNLNRRWRNGLLCDLAIDKQVDILVVAESVSPAAKTLGMLQRKVDPAFFEPVAATPRLQLFARNPSLDLKEVYGDVSGRVSIRRLRLQNDELLFTLAHLPSKRNWNSDDQAAEVQVLSTQIQAEEARQGHSRNVLVGDLNMNPFENGMVQAAGFHAVTTAAIAKAGSRTVQGRVYPFFYNPMWSFFGDLTVGPPGTFFYRHGGHLSYDWNIFDQVLIRPAALQWFSGYVEIITTIGGHSLQTANGRPDATRASDHFPLLFKLLSSG